MIPAFFLVLTLAFLALVRVSTVFQFGDTEKYSIENHETSNC